MNPQILYDIAEIVNKRKKQGKEVIKLNVGEPEQPPPKILYQEIYQALKKGRITYGPAAGNYDLRSEIARIHKVKTESVLIGPGSKFLIFACLSLLTKEKNSEVIIIEPSWSAFSLMLKNFSAKPVYVKTELKNNWQIDIAKLQAKISKKTKAIILNSPNNPTSILVDPKTEKQIIALAHKNNIKVIKDLAYMDLVFDKKIKNLFQKNAIEIHSFSKKFSMTGFRLGYLIAEKEIVEKLTKFMQITITSTPLFIQDGALALLKTNFNYPAKLAQVYKKRAEKIGKMLKEKSIEFAQPDAGFYIFADIKKNAEKVCIKLIDKGVALVPGSAFGPYPTFVRISLTETEKSLVKAIKLLLEESA